MNDDKNEQLDAYLRDVDEFIGEINGMIDETMNQAVEEVPVQRPESSLPDRDGAPRKIQRLRGDGRRIYPTGIIGE